MLKLACSGTTRKMEMQLCFLLPADTSPVEQNDKRALTKGSGKESLLEHEYSFLHSFIHLTLTPLSHLKALPLPFPPFSGDAPVAWIMLLLQLALQCHKPPEISNRAEQW